MMKSILTLTAALLFAASSLVAASPSELDRAAAALAGTTAQFTHRFTPKGFRNSQNESGTVTFGALPMMRWQYAKPEPKLFLFDGSKSWFYLPEDKQVTVTTLDEAQRRQLPFLFIGNPVERERLFNVTETAAGGIATVTLQPKDKNAAILRVSVAIVQATHQIRSIAYADRDGNQTVFELSGTIKVPLSADTFRFTAPPGVQVVQQ